MWPTKFYVGLCGDVDVFPDIIEFLSDPTSRKAPKAVGGEFLVLTEDKKLFTFQNPTKWIMVNQPFYAVGSGMNYAMAAMECGKSPIEAVKIASKFDRSTGMGFKSFDIKLKK